MFMSFDTFFTDCFTLLRDSLQNATERTHLFNLPKHVLLQGRHRIGKAAVVRLHDKSVELLNMNDKNKIYYLVCRTMLVVLRKLNVVYAKCSKWGHWC